MLFSDPNSVVTVVGYLIGGGGLIATWFTYKLGLRQAAKEDKVATIEANNAEDANALALIEKAFSISEALQTTLKKDLDDLRSQIKDTQMLVNMLSEENKKLLLENDKLMRANHQLTEDNNTLLKENIKLGEQIVEVTSRMATLEQAVRASPNAIEEALNNGHE